ncbi:DUF1178 family protein [Rhodovulum sp. 12E13]|uniref:DUF1178 family protein n=1 Tax=Rhodovulum sp. 12E13 TaxID=2203891 RepID=UPI000E132F82|nr:DUF1178 family protein [Rhodovulum sp. 12E13]RDC69012.1 DUF1178 family protein [Rhodovulum sp. 12E13]
MIKYALRCANGHAFDSWFASASAYDSLAETGRLTCAVCGGGGVEKAMMAPRLAGGEAEETDARPLARSATPAEGALAEFRRHVEANTEDVGRRFATEARAIHEGTAPERAIRGQASGAEARALVGEGVPVLPLPFPPERQVN